MDILVVAFVLCSCILTAFAGDSPKKVCRSNVVGPACSAYNPCKRGYSCINNRCCRDPVCPRGWKEGPSCNLLPGQERCTFGYNCMRNNFCCGFPGKKPGRCPPIRKRKPTGVPCANLVPPPFQCTIDGECRGKQKCCRDLCGWNMCMDPWKPRRG